MGRVSFRDVTRANEKKQRDVTYIAEIHCIHLQSNLEFITIQPPTKGPSPVPAMAETPNKAIGRARLISVAQ